MAGRVDGKVAVVTGGGSGIGRACALRFAEEGADVVIADINDAGGAESVRQVQALGRQAIFVSTNVVEEAACEAMAQVAVDQFGHVDILLAAAGGSGAPMDGADGDDRPRGFVDVGSGFVMNKPVKYWHHVIDVNLNGTMLSDRAVARRMIDGGIHGSIINVASSAAKIPSPGVADYCVAKAGVWMLTKVLARELGRYWIRVNAIGPGFTLTEGTSGFADDESRVQRLVKTQSLRRVGEPRDQADMALFLASGEADWVTGQLLHANGGVFTD